MTRPNRMTIDELSQDSGVSSRNIRYYQTRGLLPPPTVEGRVGYYDSRHTDRLRLIQELQAEGLNLQAISWLLGGAGAVDSDEVRRLKRAVLDGWSQEEPTEIPVAEVVEAVGEAGATRESAKRADALGLMAGAEDPDTVRVLLPSVLAAGRELHHAMGVPADRALDVLEVLREHVVPIAQAYVEVFDEAVLTPWEARGRPADEWPDVREAVDRIRPLAGEALLAVFRQAMTEAVAHRLSDTRAADEAPDDDAPADDH